MAYDGQDHKLQIEGKRVFLDDVEISDIIGSLHVELNGAGVDNHVLMTLLAERLRLSSKSVSFMDKELAVSVTDMGEFLLRKAGWQRVDEAQLEAAEGNA